ncbi:CDP-alcohol phosphatidyltransferase family protein [Arthrobacter roseus]|uniref:CDP-alcohol phosphatidyltransferase family protein n=1 Tax=Arthrobacter roseus TaxID=136274 RepID=UPI001963187B|nr:CDP-alcohol phosphatidyltransferase family protein [Arthrobacter roseus]MBM7848037.1 phosphatidylglycerophosphate synthase [Arthrobacter roseus]
MSTRAGAPPMYRQALLDLGGSQKTSKGAPAYSRYVNRRLGRYLAAAAYARGMTPNQVTFLSAVCTFSAILLLALHTPELWTGLVIAVLLALGYALDSADGQLARLTGTGSPAGEWLDHVVDAVKIATLHVAVLLCWWQHYDVGDLWLLVPLLFQSVVTVQFFAMILTDQLRRGRRRDHGTLLQGDGNSSPLYALTVLPTDFGLMCLLFVLLWLPPAFITVYTLLALANTAFLVLALGKWYREVRAWN